MAISEGYGRKGNDWYVNSGQSCSRDEAKNRFPCAKPDGSVPLAFIETLVGSADLVGLWAIRSYIEGKGYSRRTTQTIMRDYPMLYDGVPYTWKASLDAYLDVRQASIYDAQLQRAGVAAAHLTTDCSSGSVL
ncbi:MAG: hypothetical protein ACREXU_05270 [Gammaproteobacteria bacterium]